MAEVENKDTTKQYTKHAKAFGQFCRDIYGCRDFEDCRTHIQNYADALLAKGLSAGTIHTCLAAVCRTWQAPMGDVQKPKRVSAANSRSRGAKKSDHRTDTKETVSQRLADFQKVVGIRRDECWNLRGNNFKQDENGHWCVEVVKGKGGKYQLQRVSDDKVEFIRSYFDGTSRYVFSKDEMNNKIDLHAMRAQAARDRYREYANKLRADLFMTGWHSWLCRFST